MRHAQEMRRFHDASRDKQSPPAFIPTFSSHFDESGLVSTFQPRGPTVTSKNAFFADLGTNGRTCVTCHMPQEGWGLSAAGVRARFYASNGNDPTFRLVDGANCPSSDVSSFDAKVSAYSLILSKGLVRIGLPMPENAEFRITSVSDPYGCTSNPATGLTSPTSGIVSVYRRPLPTTNLAFLSGLMWDGREPSLQSQALHATVGHAQSASPPTAAQQQEMVDFETGLFTAQSFDRRARSLTADGATGGPKALEKQLANFFVGINDPVGLNPKGLPFSPRIFNVFQAWEGAAGSGDVIAARRAIAHGERLFNETKINITNVSGLNDVLNKPSVPGFCGTCHDSPNVGNHSVKMPLNIGLSGAGSAAPAGLDVDDLPVLTLQCTSGPLAGRTFKVTDPGRALISGKCADIGRFRGPILRGLASRAPYFHNGAAATLADVVEFYDRRFALHLSSGDKHDLVAFLNTL